MTRRTDALEVVGWALALLSTGAILAVTLRPASAAHALELPGLCLICGRFGLANVLRNVVLFVPLGVGLGLAGLRARRAWIAPALLSAGIETAQLFIPGRNSLAIDVVANSVGGAVGVGLALAATAGIARSPRARIAGSGALLLALAALGGTAAAFQLALPPPPHHVQWTPRLAHFEPYGGRIEDARLAGDRVAVGRHPDPARLETSLLGGDRLEVELVAGPPPRRLAPIFAVHTAEREEVLVLGARGRDLVLRLPFRAARLRLDRPELHLERAFDGVDRGDRLAIGLHLEETGACLALGTDERCRLRPTMGEGWALLLHPAGASRTLRRSLSLAWLVGLAFLPSFLLGSAAGAAITAAVLGAGAALLPPLTGSLALLHPGELVALLAGSLMGWGLMRLLRLVERRRRASPGRVDGSRMDRREAGLHSSACNLLRMEGDDHRIHDCGGSA